MIHANAGLTSRAPMPHSGGGPAYFCGMAFTARSNISMNCSATIASGHGSEITSQYMKFHEAPFPD
jgi:hypothetical protein